jgi:hypothetical protein
VLTVLGRSAHEVLDRAANIAWRQGDDGVVVRSAAFRGDDDLFVCDESLSATKVTRLFYSGLE